ncbi:heparan-alpha-glucosaminide N-acetyltransferase domain-containing protein [Haematomicrobium sanguinis]|uniref:heparan-alpha-glucosaminide N-acetyltransferase domain-containing protein n=1 Tax=Haematomicrobium sanguinis TaxID=479106 RepID=UPI00047A729E|nr:heparan-alpha-glucosaminide N-acetyltransferase domain-containing protein [Haematomicrobium sanguinis]
MSTAADQSSAPFTRGRPTRGDSGRLLGIDAARGLALLGMVAAHVFPLLDSLNEPTPTALIASGRSSALFAVVAGISLGLMSGGRSIPSGGKLAADWRGIAARALVVLVIGLTLGQWDSGVAVILVQYAFLFLLALPFLGVRPQFLFPIAATWLVVSPIVAYPLRQLVWADPATARLEGNPDWEKLLDPAFLPDVFLTGYYPVIQWLGYVLLGIAVARIDLTKIRVAATLALTGAITAAVSLIAGQVLMFNAGGLNALKSTSEGATATFDAYFYVTASMFRKDESWWWLAVPTPHSGSIIDLLHTSGTALLAIGVLLLAARYLRPLIIPLAALGRIPLTLYTAHVATLAILNENGIMVEDPPLFWYTVLAATILGLALMALRWKGPLEWVTAAAARLARGTPRRIP